MGGALERKGGAVPDGLHPGDGPPFLQECRRPGPPQQLGPLYVPGLPVKRLPDGAQEVSGREKAMAGEAARETNTGRLSFRGPKEGCSKGATARGEARRNAWISAETWRLVDERVPARQVPQYRRVFKRKLGRTVKASLAADPKRRADEAGAEVEALVKADLPLIQEAWYRLRQSLHLRPRLVRPPLSVRRQTRLHRFPHPLPVHCPVPRVPTRGDSLADEPPRLRRNTGVSSCLSRFRSRYGSL